MSMRDPIAIVGIGCRLPGGIDTPEKFWEILAEGRDVITEVPSRRWNLDLHFNSDPQNPLTQHVRRGGFLEDIDYFDPGFFGITPREAVCLDPQQRLLLEVAWRSIENAGQPVDVIRGRQIGVFIGISSADYSSLLWASNEDYVTPDNEPFILPGNTGCIAANRLSYFLDLKGPSFTVDTACSSSLVAVHLACESLCRGESEMAFAGGVQSLIHPGIQMSFCKAGLLSPDGRCKSFDAEANGYVRSEGAGIVLLKPLAAALRDCDQIHAVIRGTAVNSDGRSQGLAAPSQRSQAACVRDAFQSAGIEPKHTQYVEAHGTGTRQGDPIELRALGSVLGAGRSNEQPCRVGSVKTNLGHGETAAGITGLIKAALCVRERKLPPSLHFRNPNPSVNFTGLGLQVQTELESFPNPLAPLIVGVSSFGFGGTNAHAVLSDLSKDETPKNQDSVQEPPLNLLCLSARTQPALDELISLYASFINNNKKLRLNDLCASNNLGRTLFSYRFIAVAVDLDDLLEQLEGEKTPAWKGESSIAIGKHDQIDPSLKDLRLGLSIHEGREKYESLAIAIGKGYLFDWSALHSSFPHEKVKLPGYPFSRQSYWWSRLGQDTSKTSLWLDHLGKTVHKEKETTLDQSLIKLNPLHIPGSAAHYQGSLLSKNCFDLTDHRIRETLVFPGAGYISLALNMQEENSQQKKLRAFKLDNPLRISDESIIFHALFEEGILTFYSNESSQKKWNRHGELKIDLEGSNDFENIPSIPSLPSEARSIDLTDFYKGLATLGLNYGPFYRSIHSLHAIPGEAWGELVRPSNAPDRCLIDGCFQIVAACSDLEGSSGQLFLPIGLEKMIINQWPLPDKFRCHAVLKPSDDDGVNLNADLTLESEEQPLGSIVGLKLRRLTRSLIDLLFPLNEVVVDEPNLFQTSWIPLEISSEEELVFQDETIYLVGVSEIKTTELSYWSDANNLLLQPLSIDSDWFFESASVIFWPDLSQSSPELSVKDLLQVLQRINSGQVKSFLLVLEGDGPASTAMAAFLRTAMLEISSCRLTTLHLPQEVKEHPKGNVWGQIWSATNQHSELRWFDGVLQVPQLMLLDEERFRIASDGSGRLEGLHKKRLGFTPLLPGEVEVAVEATGLNFRDVLNALGLLKEHISSLGLDDETRLPFGGEAVGRVVALGEGVDQDLLGKKVIVALTAGCLASHVVARSELCVLLPKGITVKEGASFSTAFLTASYGLNSLADLKAGEIVLIHSAAGGVGQAALQIAQRAGARIFATASMPKQAALLKQGVEKVYDSRSINFADDILADTNGRGVDVVINSLKGAWVEASFRALSKGGRFVELGKIEVWSKEEALERRPDVNYFPFDLLEVAVTHPIEIRRLLIQLMKEIEKGSLHLLPLEVWPLEKCEDAFRYMAQARHVGKVVINQCSKNNPIAISSNASYLVTGAFGGVGLKLLSWLVEKGARSLILVGRSVEDPGPKAMRLLEEIESKGIKCIRVNYDLATNVIRANKQEDLLSHAVQSLPEEKPLRGVFHAAGILRDRSISKLNFSELEAVMAPKLQGWRRIENLIENISELDFLIGFSSVAALLGSPGQAAYSAANGSMEGYFNFEKTKTIRLFVQWGPWSGDGMAAGLDRRFAGVGIRMIEPSKALNALERLLQRGDGGIVAILDNDWTKLASQALSRQRSWFSSLLENLGPSPSERLWSKLEKFPDSERQSMLMKELRAILANVMAAEADDEESLDPSSIDSSDSLFNLGLDSLMAVEFAAIVQTELGIRLDLDAFSDDPSLDGLAEISLRQIVPQLGEITNEVLNLSQEAKLDDDWNCPSVTTQKTPGEKILITGSSGFLGAYLLAGQLERWPDLRVSCLVRAQSEKNGLDRIRTNLCRYDLWKPSWEKRIEPVIGDLSLPSFGLEPENFAKLASGIRGILHNGAQLSQMATYAQLAATNVGGTKEVLRLATFDKPLRVELISSVSVFEAAAYRNCELPEDKDLKDWRGIYIGYSQTKWVSERLVSEAGKKGLSTTIYRPPLIGGHSRTGYWNDGDLLQRLLQGCVALGKAPQLSWELDLVPVDYVSEAVSALAWTTEAKNRCFHLQHPRPLMLNDLLNQFISDGDVLKLVPMDQWLSAIEAEPTNPLYPLRTFFQKRWGPEQLTYPELNALGVRARPSCLFTQSILEPLNVRCPDFDELMEPWARSLLGNSLAISS